MINYLIQKVTNHKKRFTKEQIFKILAEGQAGVKVADLCRQHGISHPTYYLWKGKYADMTISKMKRLRALEEENSRLKRIVADQQLDIVALKDVLSKKW